MVARSVRPTLADVLVRQGVARETVEQTLRRLGGASLALGSTLVSEGALSEEQLAKALAAQYGLPYDPLTDFRVDQRFYDSISVKLMQRHPFVPISERAGVLTKLSTAFSRDQDKKVYVQHRMVEHAATDVAKAGARDLAPLRL